MRDEETAADMHGSHFTYRRNNGTPYAYYLAHAANAREGKTSLGHSRRTLIRSYTGEDMFSYPGLCLGGATTDDGRRRSAFCHV